jgi:hypothetical protein
MNMMADDIENDTDEGTRETMALYDNDELIISFFLEKINKMYAKSSFSHVREIEHGKSFFLSKYERNAFL